MGDITTSQSRPIKTVPTVLRKKVPNTQGQKKKTSPTINEKKHIKHTHTHTHTQAHHQNKHTHTYTGAHARDQTEQSKRKAHMDQYEDLQPLSHTRAHEQAA